MTKKIILLGVILFSFLISFSSCFAEGKIIRMVSLDWPPFAGKSIPDNGANVIVAKAAFKAMGYDLKVEFYPWARTVKLAKTKKYAGYLPEYYAKEIESEFIFSDPIGDSPLGFVERSDAPIIWESLQDLKSVGRIGTVRGYVNTAQFDMMAADKTIKVEPVVDDATNLRKLLINRINMAVIDKYVMQYILATESHFAGKQKSLQFNKRLLENKKLYLCFQKNDKGQKVSEIFNQGLQKINVDQLNQAYFANILR